MIPSISKGPTAARDAEKLAADQDLWRLMAHRRHGAELFDHLVGAKQNRWGYREAECLGGLEVDNHLKFYRHLNGQVGRLLATENAIDIDGGAKPYDLGGADTRRLTGVHRS